MSVESNALNAPQRWNPKSDERSAKPFSEGPGPAATVDLTQPAHRAALAALIKRDIDAWSAEHYDDGPRTHLGASLIGRECTRELWYGFRWVKHFIHTGRQQRLFQRGHLEEARFIEYLEGIGAEVEFVDTSVAFYLILNSDVYRYVERSKYAPQPGDENVDAITTHHSNAQLMGIFPDYPQFRVSACGGHFGGSLDAKVTLPERYGLGTMVLLNEYKTSGTGPKFTHMKDDGVQVTKHEHFCQMSYYGWKTGLRFGLYMMVNKNDDDLHIEIVQLDWALAQRLEVKADKIIQSPLPPPKISEAITHQKCSYCDMRSVCHENAPYERNCRSCVHAQPADNKVWWCRHHNGAIPPAFIPKACDAWTPAL